MGVEQDRDDARCVGGECEWPPLWRRGMQEGVARSDVGWEAPCLRASSFSRRLRGLAGVPRSEMSGVLVFPDCRSVHTFTMAYPIDVLLLDDAGRVLRSCRGVPRCMIVEDPYARTAVERPASADSWPQEGDVVTFVYQNQMGAVCSPEFT